MSPHGAEVILTHLCLFGAGLFTGAGIAFLIAAQGIGRLRAREWTK